MLTSVIRFSCGLCVTFVDIKSVGCMLYIMYVFSLQTTVCRLITYTFLSDGN